MLRRLLRSLASADHVLHALVKKESRRQLRGIELIASENFTSRAVKDSLGSCLTNKYSEGLPEKRYYGGNQYIDQIENLCIERALKAFHLNPDEWGVNVQPYSGSVANLAVYHSFLKPHDRIMGLDLPSGGHLTHGFQTPRRKISISSVFYESLPYKVNKDGFIDYDEMENLAMRFRPKMIVCGGSAYPRDWDYRRFRQVCDKINAKLFCDMSHVSGLIATQEHNNPFEYADVVSTTTHKTLRGPRSAMIFAKKEFMDAVNFAVFPAIQGGPHNHQIAGVATQLLEVQQPYFRDYIRKVKSNAVALADRLMEHGYKLSTNGTDNHLILCNLNSLGIEGIGSLVEQFCEKVGITLNKNSVVGDESALRPGGIRLGTSAMTTLGFEETHFRTVADLLHRSIQRVVQIAEQQSSPEAGAIEEELTREVKELVESVLGDDSDLEW